LVRPRKVNGALQVSVLIPANDSAKAISKDPLLLTIKRISPKTLSTSVTKVSQPIALEHLHAHKGFGADMNPTYDWVNSIQMLMEVFTQTRKPVEVPIQSLGPTSIYFDSSAFTRQALEMAWDEMKTLYPAFYALKNKVITKIDPTAGTAYMGWIAQARSFIFAINPDFFASFYYEYLMADNPPMIDDNIVPKKYNAPAMFLIMHELGHRLWRHITAAEKGAINLQDVLKLPGGMETINIYGDMIINMSLAAMFRGISLTRANEYEKMTAFNRTASRFMGNTHMVMGATTSESLTNLFKSNQLVGHQNTIDSASKPLVAEIAKTPAALWKASNIQYVDILLAENINTPSLIKMFLELNQFFSLRPPQQYTYFKPGDLCKTPDGELHRVESVSDHPTDPWLQNVETKPYKKS
jgi:hypothetical protein